MANKNYFLNGITELLVLYLLNQKDCYVYEITKCISVLSNNLLSLSQNTIYTATYKLENEHRISEYAKLVGKKRTRVYYHIEPEGQQYLEELMATYQTTIAGINRILETPLEEHDYDEESETDN